MVITKHVYEVYLKDFLLFWFFCQKDEFKNWIKRQGQNVFFVDLIFRFILRKRDVQYSKWKMKNSKFDFWNEWNEENFVIIVNQTFFVKFG